MKRILFVCYGNICRSPMGEGMFIQLLKERGLSAKYEVDSAGTHAEHTGETPDYRMQATAQQHGVGLRGRARQFRTSDFDAFDVIVAMDSRNRGNILRLAHTAADKAKVRMMRDSDVQARGADVPDPWYGGPDGFEDVYQIVERSCAALLDELETGA